MNEEYGDESARLNRLQTPIKLEELVNQYHDFSIESIDEDAIELEETDITKAFDYDKLEPYCLPENLEVPDESDEESTVDDNYKSFPAFRQKMTSITKDEKVMKMILRPGGGTAVPEDGTYVYVHYAAYTEFAEYPFDVTRLRSKKPVRFQLGNGELILGLEIAIKSMRKGENSKFLIHPDLAWRERGVPPRIPPNATILFDVDLVDICEGINASEIVESDDTLALSFEDKLKKVKRLRDKGNALKKIEKNINGAITAYRNGVRILVEMHYANEQEEKEAKDELIKFYSNLAVCYMEKQNYKRVCIMYNEALHDCKELLEKNVKLLYLSGKALRNLGNYDEACKRLTRASRLKRGDESIVREITLLEECRKKHEKDEKTQCRKMFGFYKNDDSDELDRKEYEAIMKTVSKDFVKDCKETINAFIASDLREQKLSFQPTPAERDFIKKECKRHNLLVRIRNEDNILIYKSDVKIN